MEIEIEKLTFGGAGIGRSQGKAIFVRGGLPGELLNIRITREKGSYAEAEIQEILKPSPERIEAPCPIFERCGGCQWQHLNYDSQLKAKEGILKETLQRIGGLRDLEIEPIVPSPKQYAYRLRVTLAVWFQNGRYNLGFHEESSRAKIPLPACPIAVKPIDEAITPLSQFLSAINAPRYPLDKIYLASDGNAAYITLLPKRDENPKKLNPFCKSLKDALKTENASVYGDEEKEFEFDLLGLKFICAPSVFVQANAEVNTRLVESALEWAELTGDERVLDLYSGIGNFSLHLAKRAKTVIGADISGKSVNLARKSAEINSISNVEFDPSPSELFVDEAVKRGDSFDLIILDPPREGAKEILDGMAKLSPRKIIYVSCDPPTLARDLKKLRKLGYSTVKIRPFDMFPETYHLESLALLSKI